MLNLVHLHKVTNIDHFTMDKMQLYNDKTASTTYTEMRI